jgi:hypothetical protein
MKIYKQETVQHVNATVEELAFFFLIKNLQKITPKEWFSNHRFWSKSMYPGQIIHKVTPLLELLGWPDYSSKRKIVIS